MEVRARNDVLLLEVRDFYKFLRFINGDPAVAYQQLSDDFKKASNIKAILKQGRFADLSNSTTRVHNIFLRTCFQQCWILINYYFEDGLENTRQDVLVFGQKPTDRRNDVHVEFSKLLHTWKDRLLSFCNFMVECQRKEIPLESDFVGSLYIPIFGVEIDKVEKFIFFMKIITRAPYGKYTLLLKALRDIGAGNWYQLNNVNQDFYECTCPFIADQTNELYYPDGQVGTFKIIISAEGYFPYLRPYGVYKQTNINIPMLSSFYNVLRTFDNRDLYIKQDVKKATYDFNVKSPYAAYFIIHGILETLDEYIGDLWQDFEPNIQCKGGDCFIRGYSFDQNMWGIEIPNWWTRFDPLAKRQIFTSKEQEFEDLYAQEVGTSADTGFQITKKLTPTEIQEKQKQKNIPISIGQVRRIVHEPEIIDKVVEEEEPQDYVADSEDSYDVYRNSPRREKPAKKHFEASKSDEEEEQGEPSQKKQRTDSGGGGDDEERAEFEEDLENLIGIFGGIYNELDPLDGEENDINMKGINFRKSVDSDKERMALIPKNFNKGIFYSFLLTI